MTLEEMKKVAENFRVMARGINGVAALLDQGKFEQAVTKAIHYSKLTAKESMKDEQLAENITEFFDRCRDGVRAEESE